MADDKVAGKVDDRLIALRDPYELLYWTTAVGMSEEDLTKLLADHGRSGRELPLQDRKDQFP
jgi:Protein of unknown function (DUF3606)